MLQGAKAPFETCGVNLKNDSIWLYSCILLSPDGWKSLRILRENDLMMFVVIYCFWKTDVTRLDLTEQVHYNFVIVRSRFLPTQQIQKGHVVLHYDATDSK